MVAGQAQVSMNLTDFTQTPMFRVLEAVKREAARYGTTVTHTELVGLVPEQALVDAAQWYMQLDLFTPEQIIERKLAALDEGAPLGFLESVAANTPTPGGGSVAALAGALGAGLAAMVGRLTVGKRKYAAVEEEMTALIVKAEQLRTALTARMDEDAVAFDAVMAAFKLPKGTEEEQAARNAAVQKATIGAAEVPLATARDALKVLELALAVARKANINAVSDAASAAWMSMASIQSAALNVRINATSIEDQGLKSTWEREVAQIITRAESLLAQVQEAAVTRGGL
ncbi:MAG: Methenyltetrahydrofolate cyclohydrolase [Chloroflexi bacterium ADurb.Bin360]|nr:MAG: Methenyltetrahydrofolate cyclohydrolase [Chloroflexi bacterium ADurb.Bin360]